MSAWIHVLAVLGVLAGATLVFTQMVRVPTWLFPHTRRRVYVYGLVILTMMIVLALIYLKYLPLISNVSQAVIAFIIAVLFGFLGIEGLVAITAIRDPDWNR